MVAHQDCPVTLIVLQSNLFSSLERIMVAGMFSRGPGSQIVVAPHIIAVAKLMSSNLKVNLDHDSLVRELPVNMGDDVMDNGEASLAKDATKCMYFGNQLNLLYA